MMPKAINMRQCYYFYQEGENMVRKEKPRSTAASSLEDGSVQQTEGSPKGSRKTYRSGSLAAGLGLLVAGAGTAVYSFLDKVKMVTKPVSLGGSGLTSQMSGWTFGVGNIDFKGLSYNSATNQWTIEIINNNNVVGNYTISAGQLLTVKGPLGQSTYTFELTQHNPGIDANFSYYVNGHVYFVHPAWFTDALLGGAAMAVLGGITIAITAHRIRKYNKMLREEQGSEESSAADSGKVAK
jgi:hypothetical protein